MYKKFSLSQLSNLKTDFFLNFKKIYERKRYPSLKTFLRDITKEGSTIYYWHRGTPLFRIIKHADNDFTFVDEKERIELHASADAINKMHSLMKTNKTIERHAKGSKTMSQILRHDFKEGMFPSINGKPYLVYDIETSYATNNLKEIEFYLAYAYIVDENGVGKYSFIGPESLEKFVKFMLEFDGYIVGFNSIAFDNPVSVFNVEGGNQDMIDIINEKSIDLFLLMWNLTGKRMGLNKIAQALVGVGKTLESGAEGETLMRQYRETGNEKYYKEFKKYCKNDVEMTVLVLFYLLKNKKVYLDNTDFSFTKDQFLEYSAKKISKAKKSQSSKAKKTGIFD